MPSCRPSIIAAGLPQLAAGKNLDLDAAVGGFRKNLGELVPKFFLHVAACDDRPFQRVFGSKRGRHKRQYMRPQE